MGGLLATHNQRLRRNAKRGSDGRYRPGLVPSGVVRAGMTWLSLAGFGDVSHCDWFPTTMEEDLRPADGDAFLHPMLDRRRYVSSMPHNRGALVPGELDGVLARFRREEYAKLI